uniref:Holin n=1 Tax=viral metagenome TaxID=1070528 RepID=A0A6M3J8W5_9ZZZZ
MNEEIKRYLISSAQTFFATFFSVLAATIPTLDFGNLTFAIVSGVVVAAVRAGIKVLFEVKSGRLNIQ